MSRFRTLRARFAVIALLGSLTAGIAATTAHASASTVVRACLACNNEDVQYSTSVDAVSV